MLLIAIVVVLLLVVLNGLFAMTELAVVSSREARLKAMAKSGSAGALTALKLAADPGRFLATVQSGITLITIVNGAFSGASLGEPVAQRLELAGLAHDTAQTAGLNQPHAAARPPRRNKPADRVVNSATDPFSRRRL